MPKVTFINEQVTVEASAGESLLAVAERHDIQLFRGMWPGLHCARMKGWCGRCKVWATPLAPGALNDKTSTETRFRLGGTVPKTGTMRLACQAVVSGDVEVRTRAGFVVAQNLTWDADPRHFKWRDRWDHRNDEPDEEEVAAKKAAAAARAGAAKTKAAAAKAAGAPNAAGAATAAGATGAAATPGASSEATAAATAPPTATPAAMDPKVSADSAAAIPSRDVAASKVVAGPTAPAKATDKASDGG